MATDFEKSRTNLLAGEETSLTWSANSWTGFQDELILVVLRSANSHKV